MSSEDEQNYERTPDDLDATPEVRASSEAIAREEDIDDVYPDEVEEGQVEDPRAEMTFLDHLEELRGTLIRSAIAFAVAATLILLFLKQAASILNWPLRFALGEESSLATGGLVTTGPFAVFSVIFQLTFFGGLALALPFILYFVARFIAPGLTKKELAVLRPTCIAALVLFLTGVSFSFFILAPAALKASLFFNKMFDFELLWSADRYYGMLTWMGIGVGLLFEFPLLVIAAVYAGLVNTETLKTYRPHSFVVFLVIAAIITPTTDPVTFLLLAVPMSILYQGAILVGAVIERRAAVELEEEDAI